MNESERAKYYLEWEKLYNSNPNVFDFEKGSIEYWRMASYFFEQKETGVVDPNLGLYLNKIKNLSEITEKQSE